MRIRLDSALSKLLRCQSAIVCALFLISCTENVVIIPLPQELMCGEELSIGMNVKDIQNRGFVFQPNEYLFDEAEEYFTKKANMCLYPFDRMEAFVLSDHAVAYQLFVSKRVNREEAEFYLDSLTQFVRKVDAILGVAGRAVSMRYAEGSSLGLPGVLWKGTGQTTAYLYYFLMLPLRESPDSTDRESLEIYFYVSGTFDSTRVLGEGYGKCYPEIFLRKLVTSQGQSEQ